MRRYVFPALLTAVLFAALGLITGQLSAQDQIPVSGIYFTEQETVWYAENGIDQLLSCRYKTPSVKTGADSDAAGLINVVLGEAQTAFLTECGEALTEKIDLWEQLSGEEEGWPQWAAMERSLDLSVARSDDGVLSFAVVNDVYDGGAHGMYWITGLSFDRLTGARLSLADLSDEPAAFRNACIDEILRQCEGNPEIWPESQVPIRQAVEQIVDRDSWYLTADGLIFRSDPYELAAYASGALEFVIPYDILPGLKPAYALPG